MLMLFILVLKDAGLPWLEVADSPTDVINPGMLASILQRHSQCCSYPHPPPF
jgi:hypothetical protein